ncbi:hypothetical protein J3A83DRAFT_4189823 [Scleroderma citrinum]
MYGWCHNQMMVLGAGPDILDQYRELNRSDLKVSTAVTEPNARGHRGDTLAWFWTMDVPQNTAASDWMSEFYCVNWLRTKALCERWKEKVQLLRWYSFGPTSILKQYQRGMLAWHATQPSSVRCMADWVTLSKNRWFNTMEIHTQLGVAIQLQTFCEIKKVYWRVALAGERNADNQGMIYVSECLCAASSPNSI